MKVRTRFAPSPTGYMHIGNLRTALYEYLIAKSAGGDFLLRIEDTDQKRYVEGSTDIIYNTLKMVHMDWDEGPDIGGNFGPYIQSERRSIYQEYAHKLVDLGGAHYCFCAAREEDEDEENAVPTKFQDQCKHLSVTEARERIARGEPYTIRQTIGKKGKSHFHDEVYGDIEIDYDDLDEGVLLKTDGLPTYNFANVIDDHLMEISHVVRGNEYISSTPKYNLIYEAFGWTPPIYVHVPPVMKDAQHKLSKRNGDASFQDLVAKGYLPEAIINYIALLGWNPGTEQEIFSLDELKKVFSAERLNKSPAIFDIVKLTWMNGCYIRELSEEEFHRLAMPYYARSLTRKLDLAALSKVLQPRIETFGDIAAQVDFLEQVPEYELSLYENKKMKTDVAVAEKALKLTESLLQNVSDWSNQNLFEQLKALAGANDMKNGQILYPLRIALSGKETTAGGATEIAAILGKDETLQRIAAALCKLKTQKIRQVGTGIIVRDGKILIGQRPEGKPLAGYWEFPGGKLEAGETIEQCLKREIREELSVEISVGEHLENIFYYGENGTFELNVFFAAIVSEREPVANVHQALAWVTPSELDNYKFPPADIDIVHKLKNRKW